MQGPFALLDGHEQVVFGQDDETGLRCIIAIHSTRLGPALGGTRFHAYPSEEDALVDVLRLSRAMTYKAACAGLDLGGGKAVILGDPEELSSEALLRAYGRMVESLGGRYITACDVGTTPDDMVHVARETPWATGADTAHGGSGDSGIPTARGVHLAMQACAQHRWGSPSLEGRHVAVQGLGKVGRRLVEHLVEDGARITAADVDEAATEAVARLDGVEVVHVDDVLEVDADIVSPNALGGILDERSIAALQAEIVCGGANNQLADEHEDGLRLHRRGILYAPDYVVNAGGLINVSDELGTGGHTPARVERRLERIGETLRRIFATADADDVPTATAAERVAEQRINAVGSLRRFWLPPARR
jgi:valine dehydrogenase (NAD+)